LLWVKSSIGAQNQIAQAAVKGEVLTGLLYLAPDAEDLHAYLNTVAVPFNKLAETGGCAALQRVAEEQA
jgi:hypothetical protein